MYCPKCGKKVDDNAAFCSSCGAKIPSNKTDGTEGNGIGNFFSKFVKQDKSQNYEMYEKFGSDVLETAAKISFTPTLLGMGAGKLLEKATYGNDKVLGNFVITDRSLIFKGNEYPCECMTAISPQAVTSSNKVETSVNGERVYLKFDKEDRFRLYNAIIRLNTKIKLTSKRQELRYLVTISTFLQEANEVIKSLPVSFDGDNKYEEFDFWNEPVKINDGAILSEENKILIANYMNAQKELERFYREVNPIEHAGHNRDLDVLKKLVNMMNESDNDVKAIIRKYNEKLAQEEEERARRAEEARLRREAQENGEYYDDEDLGVSLLKGVAGIAIGTALGNRGLRKESRKQTQFMKEQRERERERDRKAEMERSRQAAQSRSYRASVIRENQKRRREGKPELPIPPADWR